MKCEQVRDLLSPYIDKMTNDRETQAVEQHLATCANCTHDLEQLRLIQSLLSKVNTPSLPESFSQDFHRRFLQENKRIIKTRDLQKPRRRGWIAAGVAVLALALGIYASSFLPAGTIASIWQDKEDTNKSAPSVAVEDIIQRIQMWNNQETSTPSEEMTDDKKPDSSDKGTKPKVAKPAGGEKKVADLYETSIKVQDVNNSIKQIKEIAEANGAGVVLAPEGNGLVGTSTEHSREVALKVNPAQADNIMLELQKIGEVTSPTASKVELTQEYNQLQEEIKEVEGQVHSLQDEKNPGEEDQVRLEESQNRLKALQNKKASLEQDMNLVTVKVLLNQEPVTNN